MTAPLLGPDPSLFSGRIGVARVDITPPVGIFARNWGAAAHDVADSIHRPLSLTALTVRSSREAAPLVLVDADLGFWTALDRFQRLRTRVLEELSLDSSRFIFAMTHTHASPHLCDPLEGMAGGELLEQWIGELAPATIQVIREALASEQPSTLDWHWGRCQLASTRDLTDPAPGSSRKICGYDPGVPADQTLLLGRVCDPEGRTRATIVNYACHPTTLAWDNHAISPDYIGAMRETIEAAIPGSLAFFLQGASGELSPRYQYVGDGAVPDRHGRQLGYAALATLEDMEPAGTRLAFDRVVESGAPLAVWTHQPCEASTVIAASEGSVELPLKADLPTAEELDRQYQACTDRALAERLRRKRNLRRALGAGPGFTMPIWAWRIGDAVIVGCMAEAYSLAQTALRARFPDTHLACMNLINGTIGYLPPADRYDLDLYQVWQSPFAAGCLELYIDAAAELVEQLLQTRPG
ncbi:hypothetical protein Pan44_14440 [Caulifigura coniformis]|uniref:Neutral/alkaline non-lysosomal ceramidase n=1 Tax=Caulifigura coniformis TaxID=2527983 RepID=A0A517SBA7_9PLAN|nr:alkaline ceramidase [Caulifigura coniformis]QDT53427.1 hypothetical protein Pan44_14440 [Caulifigura coniformis]